MNNKIKMEMLESKLKELHKKLEDVKKAIETIADLKKEEQNILDDIYLVENLKASLGRERKGFYVEKTGLNGQGE